VGKHARNLEQTVSATRTGSGLGHELDQLCLPNILEPGAAAREQEVYRRIGDLPLDGVLGGTPGDERCTDLIDGCPYGTFSENQIGKLRQADHAYPPV